MTTVRLPPFDSASGAVNMATDEALLHGAGRGVASLRFYSWSEPTVSLGYFQPAVERLPGLPWVRRATGGAALVHDRELTYALALPAGVPWQRRGESWICRMHGVIAKALARFGLEPSGLSCAAEKKLGPILCFLHHTPGDLVLQGHKIAGSAQRKSRGALLQHGGILLGRSSHAPNLPGIRELAGADLPMAELAETIRSELTRETGWTIEPEEWTPAERERINELAETKYESSAWNDKR